MSAQSSDPVGSAHALFDVLSLEAAAFSEAVEEGDSAATVSERVSWLNVAIDNAFACVEFCGRLRDIDPARADECANVWRETVTDLAVIRHEVVVSRRAELARGGRV